MKILFFGHSLIARRQWSFVYTLDKTTNLDVEYYQPTEWGSIKLSGIGKRHVVKLKDSDKGIFGYYYDPKFIMNEIKTYNPEWIGGFIEPYSKAGKVIQDCADEAGIKTFFFAYENLSNNFIRYPDEVTINYPVIQRADIILCGNKIIQKFMNVFKAKRTEVIPHTGIETNLFRILDDEVTYMEGIFVGRDVYEKGWDYVDRYLNYPKYRVEKPVHFLKDSGMCKFYNSGKVFVHASLRTPFWLEQLGYVIPEALSCGRAVIMSKYGSQVEWFSKAPGVVVYDPLNEDSMKEAFEKAKEYYPNTEGRKWVIENFSNEVIARKYEKIFKEISK